MMKKSRLFWFMTLLACISLACNLSSTGGAGATQTVQAANPVTQALAATTAPVATSAPVATATDTPEPTATQAPTVTDTPTPQGPAQVIPAMNAYCRKGPGTGYYVVTTLQTGTAYNVTGRNTLNTWWLVQATQSLTCWMGDPNATKKGPVDQVQVVNVPALPQMPTSFTSSYVCKTTVTPHTLTTSFNWSAEDNVTGFHIYRNGKLLATLAATATSYHDSTAPLKTSLAYELEAFNDYGTSDRASANIPACN